MKIFYIYYNDKCYIVGQNTATNTIVINDGNGGYYNSEIENNKVKDKIGWSRYYKDLNQKRLSDNIEDFRSVLKIVRNKKYLSLI